MRALVSFIGNIALAAVLAFSFPVLPVHAISCFSDFAVVRDVSPEHLVRTAREITRRLEELGSPLDPAEAALLDRAFALPATDSVIAIQRVLDAHVLLAMSMSAESEIKVSNGPALPYVPIGKSAAFLLPVALFYHLAHNSMHFFMEAQYLLPLISDPLGRAWNLFGTAAMRPGPILSAQAIWWLQVSLILIGHIFGIVIAHHASRRLYAERRQAMLALVPMLGAMVLYSWLSLWILHLDMNMRSTLM